MDWKKILHSRGGRIGLCIILILAILFGLCSPGITSDTGQLKNPVQDEEIREINMLTVGQNVSHQSTDEDGEKESTEETDNGESEQEEEPTENTEKSSDTEQETQDEEDGEEKESEDVTPGEGEGEEGQEEGLQGEEGGEEAALDLAMVMTWYKYGKEAKTLVCGPSQKVAKTLNIAQLANNKLKYDFFPTGDMADDVKITGVFLQEGDGKNIEVPKNGKTEIILPEANAQRDYTFQVNAQLKTRNSEGEIVEEDITFTYVLHCHYALDLEMELDWVKKQGNTATITCTANDMAARTIESNQLKDKTFSYEPKLTGVLAKNAKIVKADYTTGSGKSGNLDTEGGNLKFQTVEHAEEERYYLNFEVQVTAENGVHQTVFYRFYILYVEVLDVELSFTWLERGVTPRTIICQPNKTVSTDVKKNQLSAGAVKYEMELTGADSASARILNISYESDASGGGKLEKSGSLPLVLPDGTVANEYRISAIVLAQGERFNFKIVLRFSMDVSLEMSYTVIENGSQVDRTVICENGKSKTADVIYDDQLENGRLSYDMKIIGTDISNLTISSVSCYQSGNGRIAKLESKDSLELLLKGGKTGENAFTIKAEDADDSVYEFRINVPYKHRGENSIKITTNLVDGQVVTNETKTNLSVNAWSEDASGEVVDYIPANGTDTKLIVKLDDEVLNYISTSGSASEYVLYPKNPVTGDTNTHILSIYAEDSYGNYGELSLVLKGQRNQAGQKKGTAKIYVDLTALGIGVVDSVTYEVLADEPVSYAVAKAILGMDTGDPFGAAKESLGWKGRYTGTLDSGFYLQSLTAGQRANALKGRSWNEYGSNEEEVLKAIDDYFGEGTGLATLWRCIYRNGLNKSSGLDGTYNEFDYTSGSGWLFSLDGTYYPGLSMSEYSLEDGDVLVLRYTLAYGWDVGSGTPGYGNTTGYCVTAMNGSYTIEHQMEKVQNENGSFSHVCKCCGLREDCAHEHVIYKDLGDGIHVKYCEDCKKEIGDDSEHNWECLDECHKCSECGAEEVHKWKEVAGSNTATCLAGGTRKVSCTICSMEKEEESPPTGHALNNRWNHTSTGHYQKCSVCGEIIEESRGEHQYVYDENDDDWYCKTCDAGHDWDYCGNGHLMVESATCKKIVYSCDKCGLHFVKEGTFPEYHTYVDGKCTHCDEQDPDYVLEEME